MEIFTSIRDHFDGPVEAVIFDYDGTLGDSRRLQYQWLKLMYKKHGDKQKRFRKLSKEFWKAYNEEYKVQGLRGIYENIVHADWDKHEKDIWECYNEFFENNKIPMIEVDGTNLADVIERIHWNGQVSENRPVRLRLAINTLKGWKNVRPSLEAADVLQYFDAITTYDDVLRYVGDGALKKNQIDTDDIEVIRKQVPADVASYSEKPNSIASMICIARLNVDPRRIIAIEDTSNGIRAYKPVRTAKGKYNVFVIGVGYPGGFESAETLREAGADAIAHHPNEIYRIIELAGGFS